MPTLQAPPRSSWPHGADPLVPPPRRARRQFRGVASTHQLALAGFTTGQVAELVHRGAIVPVHDGVYCTAGTILSTRRQLLAGCLAVGGVVGCSHRAALWLWDLHDATPPVELTTDITQRRVPTGAVVHVRSDLCPAEVTVHRGVPVTTVARTLCDAGSVVDRASLATAVDKAIYLRLVTPSELARRCDTAVNNRIVAVEALRAVLAHGRSRD